MTELVNFLNGSCTIMFVAAGLFFLRYWKDSRDRLFLAFAISFWLQAVARILIYCFAVDETPANFYWLRFAAFLIIIWAIIDKNRAGNSQAH